MSEPQLPLEPDRPAGPDAEALVGVIVYAYGRMGLGSGRWHDIAAVLPDARTGLYRVVVAEIPAEILRLWQVKDVTRNEARALLEVRARKFVDAEDFGADSVRLNNLDDDGLAAARKFDRTLDSAFDWALTVEGHACLEPDWDSPAVDDWRRATLSDSAGDRAGSAALVAVHGMIHAAQRLAAAPP
jgi:hypothetical protein